MLLLVGCGHCYHVDRVRANDLVVAWNKPVATLVTKDDEPKQWSAFIRRDGENVWLDEPTSQDGGAQFQFAPFYEAWGRQGPLEWMDEMKKMVDQANE